MKTILQAVAFICSVVIGAAAGKFTHSPAVGFLVSGALVWLSWNVIRDY